MLLMLQMPGEPLFCRGVFRHAMPRVPGSVGLHVAELLFDLFDGMQANHGARISHPGQIQDGLVGGALIRAESEK
jgi:hypothetical protein